MARNVKSSLEYFPFDVDFFQDIRIRKLIKRQGGKAVTVYALLLCLIYKNGYYMLWDDELPFIGSELSGFEEAYISEVIKSCLSLGLFDKNLFDSEGVLTSKGIQTRYCNIQRLNKRMSRIDKYVLIDVDGAKQKPSTRSNAKSEPKPEPVKAPKPPKTPKSSKVPKVPTPKPPQAPAPQPQPQASGSNAEFLDEFFAESHSENLLLLCKNFGLAHGDIKRLRALAETVVTEWELSHTRHRDYSDWSRHLISLMRIKNREATPAATSNRQSTPPTSDYTFTGGFGGQDV